MRHGDLKAIRIAKGLSGCENELAVSLTEPRLLEMPVVWRTTHCGWHHSLAAVLDCRREAKWQHAFLSLFPDCGCNETSCFKLLLNALTAMMECILEL